jgi:hypothetical protein
VQQGGRGTAFTRNSSSSPLVLPGCRVEQFNCPMYTWLPACTLPPLPLTPSPSPVAPAGMAIRLHLSPSLPPRPPRPLLTCCPSRHCSGMNSPPSSLRASSATRTPWRPPPPSRCPDPAACCCCWADPALPLPRGLSPPPPPAAPAAPAAVLWPRSWARAAVQCSTADASSSRGGDCNQARQYWRAASSWAPGGKRGRRMVDG